MKCNNKVILDDVAYYSKDKIEIKQLNSYNYVSTENLLPNIGGKDFIGSLPNVKNVTKYEENDILISNIRPYFKKIWNAKNSGGCSNDVLVIKAKDDINSKFLYYNLACDKFFDYVMSGAKGTKMPRGDKTHILNFNINFFSLKEQKSIANILSKLDEKIEVNNQINKKIEDIAQTIFKHWFIDFEFPNENGEPYKSSGGEMVESELGMIPKGWIVNELSEISIDIITGKTPITTVRENYGNEIPFVKIPDMHKNVYIIKTESYLSKKGIQKNKIIPKNGIMVSCIATPGIVSISSEECQTNQQINSIILNDEKMLYYTYFKLRELADYIRNLGATGSTTLNLNKSQFSKIKIVVPRKEITCQYYEHVKNSFELILENMKLNETLINLRDTLLPKLMSGEIKVPMKEGEDA